MKILPSGKISIFLQHKLKAKNCNVIAYWTREFEIVNPIINTSFFVSSILEAGVSLSTQNVDFAMKKVCVEVGSSTNRSLVITERKFCSF